VAGASRQLSDDELEAIRGYRRAARRLHSKVAPHASHKFRAHLFRENEPDAADLIPELDFLAILVAFRIIFATKSSTNFGRICNTLWTIGDSEIRRLVGIIREGWNQSLRYPAQVVLFEKTFVPLTLLEAWMNGEVFHQDAELARSVELIKNEGVVSFMLMQLAVWQASFSAVSLDGVCALVLDEEVLPLLADPAREIRQDPLQPDAV
jgi:hypothetical protein